jgi:hypothetical protein
MFETIGRVMTSPGQTLKLRCGACGHRDEWDREKALAILGPDACPYLIRHRLVCGACHGRRRTEVWI